MAEIPQEALEYFAWRKAERAKPRTMTAAEYRGWCAAGDRISGPHEANPFPGGLTIIFGRDSGVLGRTTSDWEASPPWSQTFLSESNQPMENKDVWTD